VENESSFSLESDITSKPFSLSVSISHSSWSNDTNIVDFMASKGWTSYNQLLEYFVLQVDDIVRSHGSTPVHWEEVFKAGAKVNSDVIFEVWTSQDQIKSVVQSKYRVIAAPSDVWYLE
jgi:N-acetyl-beta-hexosaminidase